MLEQDTLIPVLSNDTARQRLLGYRSSSVEDVKYESCGAMAPTGVKASLVVLLRLIPNVRLC